MRDMEFIYRYLQFAGYWESRFVGGYYKCGNELRKSTGWQGAVDDGDLHWFVKPYADTLESTILTCHQQDLLDILKGY